MHRLNTIMKGKRIHVFTTHAEYSRLSEAVRAMFPLIAEVPADHDIVIDFYVWHSGRLRRCRGYAAGSPLAAQSGGLFSSASGASWWPSPVPAVAKAWVACSISPIAHNGNTYEEEKLYRGLHPMMGKRLHLWRLSNFNIERLPSVEDVYLLHAVARDNPKDERLFACAEVRDVTPVRDEAGRIVQLPHLERMLTEALAGIRLFQSRRPSSGSSLLEPDIPVRVAAAHSGAG